MKMVINVLLIILLSMPLYAEKKEELRIFIIHSYNVNHFCGEPQAIGFKKGLKDLIGSRYDVEIRSFYMNTKTKNKSISNIKKASEIAFKHVVDYNPDFVITVDDNAFKHVAIEHLLVNGYYVGFTGLNKTFAEYKMDYPILAEYEYNIFGVEEFIDFEKIAKICKEQSMVPEKFVVLYDDTPSSRYLKNNYTSQIYKHARACTSIKPKIQEIYIKNIQDLRLKVTKLNDDGHIVIFNSLNSLLNRDTNTIYLMPDIIREIAKYNTKHLEVAPNLRSVEFGSSMAASPDFYDMGYELAKILAEIKNNKKTAFKIIRRLDNKVYINKTRMDKLYIYKVIKPAVSKGLIDKVYSK